jgi:hypothetical protein
MSDQPGQSAIRKMSNVNFTPQVKCFTVFFEDLERDVGRERFAAGREPSAQVTIDVLYVTH